MNNRRWDKGGPHQEQERWFYGLPSGRTRDLDWRSGDDALFLVITVVGYADLRLAKQRSEGLGLDIGGDALLLITVIGMLRLTEQWSEVVGLEIGDQGTTRYFPITVVGMLFLRLAKQPNQELGLEMKLK